MFVDPDKKPWKQLQQLNKHEALIIKPLFIFII